MKRAMTRLGKGEAMSDRLILILLAAAAAFGVLAWVQFAFRRAILKSRNKDR